MGRNRKHSNYRLKVRHVTVRDLDVLVHHRRGMWEDMGVGTRIELDEADPVYRKWARARLKSGRFVAWVVEKGDGQIVGGGSVWLKPVQPRPGSKAAVHPYLLSMYTERNFRGMGVGSLIIKEAVKWSKRNGYPSLLLHASIVGRRLYRKLGFKRTWEMRRNLQRKQ